MMKSTPTGSRPKLIAFLMFILFVMALGTSIYFTMTEELEVVGANYSLYVERDGRESTTTSKLRTGDVIEYCEDGQCRVTRTYARYFTYPAQRDSANITVCNYITSSYKIISKEYPGNSHNCMSGRYSLDGFSIFLISSAHFVALIILGIIFVPERRE